jgi:selenocysteine lyase/cysteine desulfurase
MTTRRSFVRKTVAAASAVPLAPFVAQAASESVADALLSLKKLTPEASATDDDLWERLAQAYTVSSTFLNLNNGGVSPQPKVVQDAVDRYYHLSNEAPTYYMWHILDRGREAVRRKLALLAGTAADEVAINRNATEALATVTWGITLNKGDEVIMTRQDYPNMIHAWKQKELREGIRIKWLNFELPIESDESIINAFTGATTSKTKVWHITHMINWTGQIMPVQKLCAEAKKRNIITIVDGAHTFAHMEFNVSAFDCDYYGTSLHKWLCAPFGTGMLYVRKENISSTWPLFPNDKPQSTDIRKFESLGTRSFAPEQAIGQAIENYWCERLAQNSRIKLNVSLKKEYSCALGNFAIDGIDPETIAQRLMNEYQIHTVAIKWENISGVRVTPHVYTLTRDLDRFIEAVLKIAAS